MSKRFASIAPWFVLSGVVALGCEAAWLRALGLLFGASLSATGALLAVFMSGLALGSELSARVVDRIHRPVLAYALAESIVGVSALSLPSVFPSLTAFAAATHPLGRLALAFALLAVPTVAMGSTLPFLTAALVLHRRDLHHGVSLLYTVNLLGAVAGALLSGFVLLPRLGLSETSRGLGAVALAIAVGASLGPAGRISSATHRSHPPEDSPGDSAPGEPLAVVVTALLGTLSFALQVGWNRALAVLHGSSAYTFASVAAAILMGTALGGGVSARDDFSTRSPWSTVTRRCFVLGITVWLSTLVIHIAPGFLSWGVTVSTHPALVSAGVTALVVVPSAYFIGALFPILASRYPSSSVGISTGRALLAVTVGNVVGALSAAFVCIPHWGLQGTLDAVALGALSLACVTAARVGSLSFRATAIATGLACILAPYLQPRWDPASLSAGTYRTALYHARSRAHGVGCGPSVRFTTRKVLYYREGAVGTVVVLGFPSGPQCSLYSLRIDGKAEGSVFVSAPLSSTVPPTAPVLPVGDLPTEILAGLLPGILGPPPTDALLVGWGTGISARALLSAGTRRLTAVELEPAVLAASSVFDPDTVHDPRVRVILDDARVVLRRAAPRAYDVIASHPSNPWVVGAASLFSLEYFSLARSRLRPGGRMLAWVQLYETDRDAVRSLVATFVQVFPDSSLFQPAVGARDLLLVGTRDGTPVTESFLREEFSRRMNPSVSSALATAGISSIDALMARRLAGGPTLSAWAQGATINTEDNAWLEFRVADHLGAATAPRIATLLSGLIQN